MTASAGQVAVALLLPPLAVFRAHGADAEFAIACVLTVLGLLPGIAYALYMVVGRSPAIAR